MRRTFITDVTLVVLAAMVLLGVRCSLENLAAGGPGSGSETTNGLVATVRYQGGTPAAYASVRIRPSGFLGDTAASLAKVSSLVFDTLTDSAGRISFHQIDTGMYAIEVLDTGKSEGVLLRAAVHKATVIDFGVVFLNPLGGFSGSINCAQVPTSEIVYVQIYGLDVAQHVDRATGNFTISGIPAGSYSIRISTSQASIVPCILDNISVISGSTTSIDTAILAPLSSWSYSKNVWFNTTAEGADILVPVYNIPVLLRLSKDNFDFATARAGGTDLCFVKPDNTPLPYQVEQWDSADGHAEVWVKVDTIKGNTYAPYITMLWGNASSVLPKYSSVVFDTSRGFQGVWHMNEAQGDSVSDATENHYNGKRYSMDASSAVSGMIGTAQKFDGKTSYIVLTNTASSKLNFPQNGTYSVSAWVYAEMLDNAYHSIVSKSNMQYSLQLTNDSLWEFFEYRNRAGWQSTEIPATAKAWKYLVGVRSGTSQYLYVDGLLADSVITTTAETVSRITTDNVCIGRRTADTTRWFNGMIDEVRLCSWSNDANWIKLCYMNQKQQDELVSYNK
jgi:hypothetical protein